MPADIREQVESVLPDAEWYEFSAVVFDDVPQATYSELGEQRIVVPVIADVIAMSLLDLSPAQQARLEQTGVLSMSPFLAGELLVSSDGSLIPIDAGDPVGDAENISEIPSQFRPELLITPAFARTQGFDTQVNNALVDNATDLTDDERRALNSFGGFNGGDSFVGGGDVSESGNSRWGFYVDGPSFEVPWALIQLGALVAALVMVLLVVAIGLSLAATESKDERDVLHTIGASPKTLRRVAAAKAWVLTTGAAAVSIPTGYSVVRVITWVNETSAPFPIVGALGIAIVIPAVAWAATLAISAIAQRFRPVHVSTVTID